MDNDTNSDAFWVNDLGHVVGQNDALRTIITSHRADAPRSCADEAGCGAGKAQCELHDELGSLYAMERDWAPAEQEVSEAVKLKDDLASAHLHLALVLEAERKPGVAEEYAKAYSVAPGDPVIVLAMGKALADAGRDSEAVPLLEHAVQLQPRSAEAAYQLAIVLQPVDRVPEAIDLLRKVVLSEPANAAARRRSA